MEMELEKMKLELVQRKSGAKEITTGAKEIGSQIGKGTRNAGNAIKQTLTKTIARSRKRERRFVTLLVNLSIY